ncbi:hypothetical protein ScPMuIL_008103 [Solemya velum]
MDERNIDTGGDQNVDANVTVLNQMSFTTDTCPRGVGSQDSHDEELTTVARMLYQDVSVLFSYKLSSQPSSFFYSSGLPREPQKSTLANALWSMGDCAADEIHPETEYVLDGGSLIHKLPWKQKLKYELEEKTGLMKWTVFSHRIIQKLAITVKDELIGSI